MRRCILTAVLGLLVAVLVSPAMAAHVSCGQVLTQNTVLDSDLTNCPGNGVVVSDGITLDLAEHTIDGQDRGYGVSIQPPASGPVSGVRVRHGKVREFADGLRIERVTGTFERLVLEDNAAAGARCVQTPLPDAILSELTVQNNATGIASDSCNIAVSRSVIQQNSGNGFDIGFTVFAIRDSGVWANGGYGAVLGAVNGTLADSSIYGNTAGGVAIFFAGVTVSGNTFGANGGNGLEIGFGSSSTVVENVASSNEAHGIRLEASSVARQNTANLNGADGLHVESGAQFELTGNRTDSNGDDGLDVDGPDGTLTGNVANRNTDLGIEAAPGTVDGGGNRARQNGNPLQCLNIACRK